MMFILEKEILNVNNSKIKPLLDEVFSSYNQGNYRSAVVVNYTAIIMDLLDKMSYLSDIYQDEGAKAINSDIKKQRENNITSPKWEWSLIEQIEEKTELLNKYELEDLNYIKTQRNYAAHPVVSYNQDEWSMKDITQETCIDVIRKSYEMIFLKQPILGNKILFDIIEFSYKLDNVPGMAKVDYEFNINEKYLKQLNRKVKDSLIKSLYKFIFILPYADENGVKYRKSNTRLFILLIKEDIKHSFELLSQKHIESLIIDIETTKAINENYGELNIGFSKSLSLGNIIGELPQIKEQINQATINNLNFTFENLYYGYPIKTKNEFFYFAFNSRAKTVLMDLKIHLENMLNPISELIPRITDLSLDSLELLYSQCLYYGSQEMFIDYIIDHVTDAKSFSTADMDMSLIPWLYNKMTIQQFNILLFKINKNTQFFWNSNFSEFFKKLSKEYESLYSINFNESYHGLLYNNIVVFETKPTMSNDQIIELLSILNSNNIVNELNDTEISTIYSNILHKDDYREFGNEYIKNLEKLNEKIELCK